MDKRQTLEELINDAVSDIEFFTKKLEEAKLRIEIFSSQLDETTK